jgi:hypothetical protein
MLIREVIDQYSRKKSSPPRVIGLACCLRRGWWERKSSREGEEGAKFGKFRKYIHLRIVNKFLERSNILRK